MSFPVAPPQYSQQDQTSLRRELAELEAKVQKKGEQYVPPRLIMTDTSDGKQYVVTLTSGALVFTAL